jgi:hypothetical protein
MYRHSDAPAPCHRCKQASQGRCPCCERPVCKKHLNSELRCVRCNENYYHHIRSTGSVLYNFLLPGFGPLLAFGGYKLADHAVAGTGIVGVLLVLGALYLVVVLRRRRLYAHFCRIMREGGTIPSPDAEREAREAAYRDLELRRHAQSLDDFEAARGEGTPD